MRGLFFGRPATVAIRFRTGEISVLQHGQGRARPPAGPDLWHCL